MKFVNYMVVKFALFLTAGILIAHYFSLTSSISFYVLFTLLILLFISWAIARRKLFQTVFFGIITYCLFFTIGIISYQLRIPVFQKNHYSRVLNNVSSRNFIQLKIKTVLKSDYYNNKYIAEVIAINKKPSQGKILLSIKKDSSLPPLTIDDVILSKAKFDAVRPPLNPHQFDYSKYMKTLGVWHQLHLSNNEILMQFTGSPTLRGKAEKVRGYIIEKLKRSPLTDDELAITQALLLGQRNDISKEMYSDYAAAGAIHILAVSGLHVGIILVILLIIFRPLNYLKKGKLIITVLTILSLWGFAFITGLSPSVVRAVTMFSFLGLAKLLDRETSSINTLFLSYFVLLLINPMWLFHVGFQLSYLAVFFILWVVPLFNKLYYPNNFVLKKVWGILSVTFAAQVGVIPLSLYYFHQFPGLFFLTNIIILPFLGIILGAGLLVIVLTILNILPVWVALGYNYLIKGMNYFIYWIAHQEWFLLQNIHFTIEKVLASYLLIVLLILLWKNQKPKYLHYSLISFLLLISVYIFDKYKNASNELIIFHKSRNTLIGYKHSKDFLLLESDTSKNKFESYPLKGYIIEKHLTNFRTKAIPDFFSFKEQTIFIIDTLGVYPTSKSIDIVLLSKSPKVNLERLIDSINPKIVIADGNNYKSYISRWKKTCEEKKLPFHFTGKDGAYVFK